MIFIYKIDFMNVLKLPILLLFIPLFLSTGCIDTKQALDLLQSVGGDAKPSNDWINRLGRIEGYLGEKYRLKLERVPLEGDLQSYNVRVPREADMNKLLADLEGYEIQLDRFLAYTPGDFGGRAEWQKKLEAVKEFLDNYDRKDEFFTSPPAAHD